MFNCNQCGSVYLREEDALKCSIKTMEQPLIQVSRILIDDSYDVEVEIRCYAVKPRGHEQKYYFEWQSDPNSDKWSHIYTYHGNEHLNESFGEQLHSNK